MKRKIMLVVLASLFVLAMGTSAFAATRSSSYSGGVTAYGTAYMGGAVTYDLGAPVSMRDVNATAYYDEFLGSVPYQSWVTVNGTQASYIASGFTGAEQVVSILPAYQAQDTTFRFRVKSTMGNEGDTFRASGTYYISNFNNGLK